MKEEKNAALILGLIAVVAVIGLVMMFTNNNKATGPAGNFLYDQFGNPAPKVQVGSAIQTIRFDSQINKVELKDPAGCPSGTFCELSDATARELRDSKQFNCVQKARDNWMCTPIANRATF